MIDIERWNKRNCTLLPTQSTLSDSLFTESGGSEGSTNNPGSFKRFQRQHGRKDERDVLGARLGRVQWQRNSERCDSSCDICRVCESVSIWQYLETQPLIQMLDMLINAAQCSSDSESGGIQSRAVRLQGRR